MTQSKQDQQMEEMTSLYPSQNAMLNVTNDAIHYQSTNFNESSTVDVDMLFNSTKGTATESSNEDSLPSSSQSVVGIGVSTVIVVLASIVVAVILLYLRHKQKLNGKETFKSYTNCSDDDEEMLDDVFCMDDEDLNCKYSTRMNERRNGINSYQRSGRTSENSTSDSNTGVSIQTTVMISPDCQNEADYVFCHFAKSTTQSPFCQTKNDLPSEMDTNIERSNCRFNKTEKSETNLLSAACLMSEEPYRCNQNSNMHHESIELATLKGVK